MGKWDGKQCIEEYDTALTLCLNETNGPGPVHMSLLFGILPLFVDDKAVISLGSRWSHKSVSR